MTVSVYPISARANPSSAKSVRSASQRGGPMHNRLLGGFVTNDGKAPPAIPEERLKALEHTRPGSCSASCTSGLSNRQMVHAHNRVLNLLILQFGLKSRSSAVLSVRTSSDIGRPNAEDCQRRANIAMLHIGLKFPVHPRRCIQ